MKIFEYGNQKSDLVLVQMADGHDLSLMEREVELIREYSPRDFRLLVFNVDDWNRDLSPWCAPAVFGNEDFGSGAGKTLEEVLDYVDGKGREYIIGGYSLAGLFALWASFESSLFSSVAAASPLSGSRPSSIICLSMTLRQSGCILVLETGRRRRRIPL